MNKKISFPIALTIIIVLAVLVVGEVFTYQYYYLPKQEVNIPIIETPKIETNQPAVQYIASLSEYRYYTGTLGKQKVHLVYWPLRDYSGGEGDNFWYVGKMVYDNVNEIIMDISIDFTSGGAMDGGATINGKEVAEFTNRDISDEQFIDCEKKNMLCGEWTDKSGLKSSFILIISQPFKIEDFLKGKYVGG